MTFVSEGEEGGVGGAGGFGGCGGAGTGTEANPVGFGGIGAAACTGVGVGVISLTVLPAELTGGTGIEGLNSL